MMPDMEKVIKALECRKNADKRCGNPCEESGMCHYATAVRGLDGDIYRPFVCDRKRICADALALLKEQEAVEPKTEPSAKGYWYTCGVCGWWLFEVRDTVHFDDRKRIHFCASCGRSVKWE